MRRRLLGLASASVLLVACGGPARIPLALPLMRDPDDTPFSPAPAAYDALYEWDGINETMFRPIARFFAVDPAGHAADVNAYDEVPDSSWFTNRIGTKAMTVAEMKRGACDDKVLDPKTAKKGEWIIDQGKPSGANPGFRVNIPGAGKFMLKTDLAGEPDRATGATSVAARLYHAAGYFAPCDSVVYFDPSLLTLEPGLKVTDNAGVSRPFDQKALDAILKAASTRDSLTRMVASKWLPGKTIGPYKYAGTRGDDPNDVVDHEDRRELRAARLMAAWMNHFDTREANTMNVFLSSNEKDPKSPGYVRHYIIDLGDCFGSVWQWEEWTKRLGFAYYVDVPYILEDFFSLGTIDRPWDHAEETGGTFKYFSARDFDPEYWRSGYPNAAFVKMTEQDGAWIARIIARFTDELVEAAVDVGDYTPKDARYLSQTLISRRDAILRRYLTRLSPIAEPHLEGDALCGTDMARKTHVVPDDQKAFFATLYSGPKLEPKVRLVPDAAPGGNAARSARSSTISVRRRASGSSASNVPAAPSRLKAVVIGMSEHADLSSVRR